MTAFGRAGDALVNWEIRSVNHRYLELAFRLPEPFKDLEQRLRQATGKLIRRGKVDATLRLQAPPGRLRLDGEALRSAVATIRDIREHAQAAGAELLAERTNPLDLMRWPGVLVADERDTDRLKNAAMTSYGEAVRALVAHRVREGAGIARLLRERLCRVESIVRSVRALAAGQATVLRERLQARLEKLVHGLDVDRLEQEALLLAQRSDVSEELDRVDIHVDQARASLDGDAPCGRRLDFLLQELSREANTLAAKSALPQAARLAVDLKVAIEQMREQVQNVE